MSFAEASYRVSEGTGTLVVNITRSGDTNIVATVLAASDNLEGTASGKVLGYQPTLDKFQISFY